MRTQLLEAASDAFERMLAAAQAHPGGETTALKALRQLQGLLRGLETLLQEGEPRKEIDYMAVTAADLRVAHETLLIHGLLEASVVQDGAEVIEELVDLMHEIRMEVEPYRATDPVAEIVANLLHKKTC